MKPDKGFHACWCAAKRGPRSCARVPHTKPCAVEGDCRQGLCTEAAVAAAVAEGPVDTTRPRHRALTVGAYAHASGDGMGFRPVKAAVATAVADAAVPAVAAWITEVKRDTQLSRATVAEVLSGRRSCGRLPTGVGLAMASSMLYCVKRACRGIRRSCVSTDVSRLRPQCPPRFGMPATRGNGAKA